MKPVIPQGGIVGEAAMREARATELGAVVALVERALADAPYAGQISAFYADRVVTAREGRKWAYPYTVGEDNSVTLGQPEEVVEQHVPVAMREAFERDEVRLVEASDQGRFLIRVIKAGESLNKVTYPAEVLREAASKFDGARVFVKADDVHVKGGGKDFGNLAGVLENARFSEANGGEILADLVTIDRNTAEKLREALRLDLTNKFGFSIDAEGRMSKRGGRKVARSIDKVASVDLIVEPAAGGELIRMVEALDRNPNDYKEDPMRARMIEAIRRVRPDYTGEGLDDAAVMADFREAVGDAGGTGAIEAATEAAMAKIRMVEAKADAKLAIADCKLPAKAKEKLITRFAEATAPFSRDDVTKAIADEAEYLGHFVEGAKVTMAGLDIEVEDRSERIRGMLQGFFDGTGEVKSFKEAYIEITGDKLVTGQLRDCDRARMAESLGVFREAIDSSTFADALGDSITRQMQAIYTGETDLDAWRKVCRVGRAMDFRTQERIRIGGYGNLPTVNEGADYTPLTSPGDDKATFAVSKRGGLETLTIEMIKNDDVGAVLQIPVELALAAKNTLYEFAFDFFRTNPTVYDGNALYHAAHANLFTAALDATQFSAHRLAMAKQTRAGSAKRLGLQPMFMLVPWELQETAYNLFQRGSNNDKTFVQAYNPEVIVPAYWSDGNEWVTVANPMRQAAVEIAFLDGKETPELFIQDSPTVGSLFSADKITYKIRHIYGGVIPVDGYKATTKAVVPNVL
jgi:hypothetical protein